MNWKYWDRHKAAAIVSAVSLILMFAITNIISTMEDNALKYAADKISIDEANAIIKYFDFYNQELPTTYHILDSWSTVIWYIAFLGALYSAWTALDIPERYRKEEVKPTSELGEKKSVDA